MSLCVQLFLRRISSVNRRSFVTTVRIKDKEFHEDQLQPFRTIESNPVNHTAEHINKFYTIPGEVCKVLFQHEGMPKRLKTLVNTFNEYSVLIRQPAVEIISYLNNSDYSRPVNKFVLYGKPDTGKSIILTHLMHYAYMQKAVIFSMGLAPFWFLFPKEVANSSTPGIIDLPVDAGKWLMHFKHQNEALLSELDLRISNNYEWSVRETSTAGSSVLELVEFGISRIKFACDVIKVLVKELKLASTEKRCRTMVFIDHYNVFWGDTSNIRDDHKQMVPPKQVSLSEAVRSITNYDWCNGAVILAVSPRIGVEIRESELPRYLLGKEGFEHIDPFLPIHIENYTDDEFNAHMEYYRDRKWIRNVTPEGETELRSVTNRNPGSLMERCRWL